MKNNKLTVTIGMSAYNEEVNIRQLLENLLLQSDNFFVLKRIIVISDGSSDSTVDEVKKVKSDKILLINDGKRKGKSNRLNEIVKMFSSDYLVILDADILPANRKMLDNLIEPFLKRKNIGIISAKRIPIKANSFFEETINQSVEFKLRVFEKMNNGNNLYMCFGPCRAFSKRLVKKLSWPPTVAEDVYSYLFCRKSEYEFLYNPRAKILYKSPGNFKDHEKQSRRFKNGCGIMNKYFGDDYVKKEHHIPPRLLFESLGIWFKNNPLYLIYYLLILVSVRVKSIGNYDTGSKWNMSLSSKKLN